MKLFTFTISRKIPNYRQLVSNLRLFVHKNITMVFFGTVLEVANRLGTLIALHPNNPYYKLITVACFFSVLNMAFHTGYFCFESIGDFDKFTSVLGAFLNIMMHASKACFILLNSGNLLALYYKIRKLCYDPRKSHYADAQRLERKMEIFSRFYIFFIMVAAAAVTFNPFFVQFIEYYNTGKVMKFRWEMPFPFASPFFNLKSSPAYEITYAIFLIAIIPFALFAVSPDLLFMAVCVHIYGLFKHLTKNIRNCAANPSDLKVLRRCVDYQNTIYGIVDDTKSVFGNLFFCQCFGSMVIVYTQVFVATQVRNSKLKESKI